MAPPAFPVVGIGASAGGLQALSELLHALPPDPGMAFVVVSHLAPARKSVLDTLLQKEVGMPVVPVRAGTVIAPNRVYVVTPGTYVTVSRGVLRTSRRGPANCKPSVIDHFFASLAQDQGAYARAIVLSGTGDDGTEGLRQVRLADGFTFAQEPGSAQFGAMPEHAIAAGYVDFVLSPQEIARKLCSLGALPARRPHAGGTLAVPDDDGHGSYDEILALVRRETGTDFAQYRSSTLRRRIARRMGMSRCDSMAVYLRQLRRDSVELRALYDDLLIHVSSFFRDPEAFRALERKVIAALTHRRRAAQPIRVWVAGCSRGEEVYSIGMLLLEHLGRRAERPRVQLFGTDLSASAINAARSGRFPQSIAEVVTRRRLERFFVRVPEGYQVARELRDLCVFAVQDVTSDPPFSNLDLISSRNLLMYFDRPLQAQVLEVFAYVLRAGGYLFLGRSESVSADTTMFRLVDRKHRIFQRRAGGATSRRYAPALASGRRSAVPVLPAPSTARPDWRVDRDRLLAERYAPPGLYVDQELHILSFHGEIADYLHPEGGDANLTVSKMVPAGLALDIRTAVHAVGKSGRTVRREATWVAADGQSHELQLSVIPMPRRNGSAPAFLVLFERGLPQPDSTTEAAMNARERRELPRLRKALGAAREQLRTVIEEHEAAQQELHTAHEEVLSSNEELQSSNEELETGKEELQAANEELTTINEELQRRNEELDRVSGELSSLIADTSLPMLNLDRERCLVRFSPQAQTVFNLVTADIGRPLSHINPAIDVPDLDECITAALRRGVATEREVRDSAGRWHALRVRPYMSRNNRIGGVLVTQVDVDAARRRTAAIVDTIREPLLLLDAELRVQVVNPAYGATFRVKPVEMEGQPLFKLNRGQWDVPALRRAVGDLLRRKNPVDGLRIDSVHPRIGRRVFMVNGQPITDAAGTALLLVFLDVTEQEEAAARLRALTVQLLSARDEQQQHLAHALHDLSSSGLAGLGIELARFENLARTSPAEAARGLRAAREKAMALAKSLHELARHLHPTVLDDLGLATALTAECRMFAERSGFAVSCDPARAPARLAKPVALSLFRVAQEALRNVERHARPHKVEVRLSTARGWITLQVRDDGVGFRADSARRTRGLGLLGMTERMAAVGGSFEVDSTPGKGTTVYAKAPVSGKAEPARKRRGIATR